MKKNNIIKIIILIILIIIIILKFFYKRKSIGLKDLYKNPISTNNEYKDYIYDEYDNYTTIVSYNGNDTNIEIPTYIEGKPVLTIEDSAFYGNHSVKKIIISKNVIRVGHQAFIGCSKLQEIYIPSSVLEFGRFALDNCPKLKKIIVKKNSNADKLLTEYGYKNYLNYN